MLSHLGRRRNSGAFWAARLVQRRVSFSTDAHTPRANKITTQLLPDYYVAQPTKAVVLAAGLGSRLRPFTENMPKAFVPVAGKPMIAHSLDSLRAIGMQDATVVTGYKSEVFAERKDELGSGVDFLHNKRFDSTEMLMSFFQSSQRWDPQSDGLYMTYSDIVFSESVARKLQQAEGDICVVVDRDFGRNGGSRIDHPFSQVETVAFDGVRVTHIGKDSSQNTDSVYGEFIGLLKVSARGRQILLDIIDELGIQVQDDGSVHHTKFGMEVLGRPLTEAYLCDLLQHLINSGVAVTAVPVFGNWREVDTPFDLMRANSTMGWLNDQSTHRRLIAQMGSQLLSEANDLKRPLEIAAAEMGVELPFLDAFMNGDVELDAAHHFLRTMSTTYPVALSDLLVETDDTAHGARITTAAEGESTRRILDRQDRTGVRTPYYEYRDSAMSRLGPFRPEWIKELRVVEDNEAENPDVQYNNGHLMMQTTLFIGPVNFYYIGSDGKKKTAVCNTGDSNFITSFVPHSFASRDPDRDALIIAVTYGGQVRSSLADLGRIGSDNLTEMAGDRRDAVSQRATVLNRHIQAESMSPEQLTPLAVDSGVSSEARVAELVAGAEPTPAEVSAMATALSIRESDLMVAELKPTEEIVVTRYEDSLDLARDYGSTYNVAPLARTRHQPDLKTFSFEVKDEASPGAQLQVGLHQFIYNYGTEPIEFEWGPACDKKQTLQPGDSTYVAPMVPHRFNATDKEAVISTTVHPNGTDAAKGRYLFVVRIPGSVNGGTLAEFSTYQVDGRVRVGQETMRWYN